MKRSLITNVDNMMKLVFLRYGKISFQRPSLTLHNLQTSDLVEKGLSGASTLAQLTSSSVMEKNSFITSTPGQDWQAASLGSKPDRFRRGRGQLGGRELGFD